MPEKNSSLIKKLAAPAFILVLLILCLAFIEVHQKVQVVTFSQLQKEAETKTNDTLYVVNFWATWCKPCIEEMPFFEEASKSFTGKKIKLIYVSLNSVKEKAAVQRFMDGKKIQNSVFLLNAPNPNLWIDLVDPSWSGSIPATVMYKGSKKVFFKEGEFTLDELNSTINTNNTK